KECTCLPYEINKYQRKISGPIIDRIDLYVSVDEVKHESLLRTQSEESSEQIQKRVIKARERQLQRYENNLLQNADLSNSDIKKFAAITDDAEKLLNKAAEQLAISARSYM